MAATPGRSRPLCALAEGERATVAAIPGDDRGLASDLASLRILPGETIEVLQKSSLGPVLVRIGGGVYAVGHDLAERVFVEGR